jgi:hypothetical protein
MRSAALMCGLDGLRKKPSICIRSAESIPQGLKAPLIRLAFYAGDESPAYPKTAFFAARTIRVAKTPREAPVFHLSDAQGEARTSCYEGFSSTQGGLHRSMWWFQPPRPSVSGFPACPEVTVFQSNLLSKSQGFLALPALPGGSGLALRMKVSLISTLS